MYIYLYWCVLVHKLKFLKRPTTSIYIQYTKFLVPSRKIRAKYLFKKKEIKCYLIVYPRKKGKLDKHWIKDKNGGPKRIPFYTGVYY